MTISVELWVTDTRLFIPHDTFKLAFLISSLFCPPLLVLPVHNLEMTLTLSIRIGQALNPAFWPLPGETPTSIHPPVFLNHIGRRDLYDASIKYGAAGVEAAFWRYRKETIFLW
ncbi:hypothetical protein I350_00804 [Cryptococcus amylolentus CBS 6273]|uniref:Uncharacterized protein n=1 Tax=Cryptococcus amylolentus CBS 6273 TaxID=1296118 RepID=A0A1E3KG05_9TREE|nr:hypothetical protein I350_00804 [Cryptococcus amylolentus CBS 6273]